MQLNLEKGIENEINNTGLYLENLPYIFNKSNSSENLLEYLAGVTHFILYLAREPFLGRDTNNSTIQKVYK